MPTPGARPASRMSRGGGRWPVRDPNAAPKRRTGNERFGGGGGWDGMGDYMAEKEEKLREQQRAHVVRISDVLRGVVLHIDGLTSVRSVELADLVTAHGGEFVMYPHWSKVTHLVANVLPRQKVKQHTTHLWECRRRGKHFFVVKEAWLVQSAARACRLPEADFALPEMCDHLQGTLRGFRAGEQGAPSGVPQSLPPPTSEQRLEGIGGIVLHVDVDSFFVQCHQVSNPARYPRNIPLAVQQHQDIIALSPLAKRAGVQKHMSPADARRFLTPCGGELVHVPCDGVGRVTYRFYEDHSRALVALWRSLALASHPDAVVELHPSSKDEVWIDTALREDFDALAFAQSLQEATRTSLGFEVSVGLAWCKPYAKLASLAAKSATSGIFTAITESSIIALMVGTRLANVPLASLSKQQRSALEKVCAKDRATDMSMPRHLREKELKGADTVPGGCSLFDVSRIGDKPLRRALTGEPRAGDAPGYEEEAAAAIDRTFVELRAICSGDGMLLGADRVRVRPPHQRISASCSLATETRQSGFLEYDLIPVGCTDRAAQDKWVRSCAVDVLQRSTVHLTEHRLVPMRLELQVLMVPVSRGQSFGRSSSAALDPRVIKAIGEGTLRYTADQDDETSAAALLECTEHVMRQTYELLQGIVEKARGTGFPKHGRLKKFMLALTRFAHVDANLGSHPTISRYDIRRSLVTAGGRGAATGTSISAEAAAADQVDDAAEPMEETAAIEEVMPPPPPKRQRTVESATAVSPTAELSDEDDAPTQGEPAAPRIDVDEELPTQGEAAAPRSQAADPAWFVSVRIKQVPGESSAECDSMQSRLLEAMRTRLPSGSGSSSACPVLPDQAITLKPVDGAALSPSHIEALRSMLRPEGCQAAPTEPADEPSTQGEPAAPRPLPTHAHAPPPEQQEERTTPGDEELATQGEAAAPRPLAAPTELGAVGVGVASEPALAMLAAHVAVNACAGGGTYWVRTADDARELLGGRPCSALLPLLHVCEVSALQSEGVSTCAQLESLGGGALATRFGAQRTRWILEASRCALPSERLILAVRGAGGVPAPRANGIGEEDEAATQGEAAIPRPAQTTDDADEAYGADDFGFADDADDADAGGGGLDWQLPSCSQVDESVISEIGGAAGEQIRSQLERARRQRAASESAMAAVATREMPGAAGSSAGNSAAHAAAAGADARRWAATAGTSTAPLPQEEERDGLSWECVVCTYKHWGEEANYLMCKVCDTERSHRPTGSADRSSAAGGSAVGGSAVGVDGLPSIPQPTAGRANGRQVHFAGQTRGWRGGGGRGHSGPDLPRRSPFGTGAVNNAVDRRPQAAASSSGGGASSVAAGPSLEQWESVQPFVKAWLESEETPNASMLLTYARSLVENFRLDELGCLARQLERVCVDRPGCVPMLREFADAVDAMVRESYGGPFHPLHGVRALVSQLEGEVASSPPRDSGEASNLDSERPLPKAASAAVSGGHTGNAGGASDEADVDEEWEAAADGGFVRTH